MRLLEAINNSNARSSEIRDLFQTDVSPASVLTLYLLPDVNLAIRSRLLATSSHRASRLYPGGRVASPHARG